MAKMILTLDIEAMQLGQYDDPVNIFELSEKQALQPELRLHQQGCLRHFSFDHTVTERLLELRWDADAVFVLLPEAPIVQAKGKDYQRLLDLIPSIKGLAKVYLFPYGRSALQLAMRQAVKLFSQQQVSDIQLIAYHEDPRLITLVREPSTPASQCFIAGRLRPADKGFVIPWTGYEVQTSDKSTQATIAALIQRYQRQCGKSLSQCYFPTALPQALRDGWLHSVEYFQDSLTSRSQFIFADALIGDLGVCSGIYNLCHCLMLYQQQKYAGTSFQLALSDDAYRSAMTLRWVA
ncbi:hypothetical protein [Agarivorans sp. QJM3NY_33]|uniref:hypothetical protein n=1 Tax=Agarivorans sp. QJM3NY_33 TaxID=3421432 RepID=UPI003F6A5DF8